MTVRFPSESFQRTALERSKTFIRDHFEQFVNRKNLDIADVNFAPDFARSWSGRAVGYVARPNGRKTVCGKCAEDDFRI